MTDQTPVTGDQSCDEDKSRNFLALISELIRALPEMPPVIMELRIAISDPSTDYTRLVPILEKDPELCADLLRFANSAYYGVEHRVETITEAVRYFGMTNLVELVAASFSERVIKHAFHDLSDIGSYFRHAVDVSRGCGLLASALGINRREKEVYVMAGILHDIGRLIMAEATNRTGAPLGGETWDQLKSIVDEENDFTGTNHAVVSAEICGRWGFPEKLIEAVRRHHTPVLPDEPFSANGALLFLAHYVVIPDLPHGCLKKALPESALKKLNMDVARLYDTRMAFLSGAGIPGCKD